MLASVQLDIVACGLWHLGVQLPMLLPRIIVAIVFAVVALAIATTVTFRALT